jgi:hypothetical protein
MPTIFTVNGASRSGKDVLTNLLKSDYNFKHIHPLANLYTFLENHFDLPDGSIMNGSSKSFICEGGEITLAESLVQFYHFTQDKKIGNWSYPYVKKELNNNLINNNSVVFSGLRNMHEAELIINHINKFPDTLLVSVWIDRPGFTGYSSDNEQLSIYNSLTSNANVIEVISNDSDLNSYLTTLKTFLSELPLRGV